MACVLTRLGWSGDTQSACKHPGLLKSAQGIVYSVQEGFARFALEVYTNDAKQRGNSFVHLTNSSIQEENPTSCQNLPQFLAADKHHKAGGSKMSLSRLWPLLKDQGLDMTLLWERLCSATLAALYSAQDAIPSQV